jgi:hypothetical protein
MPNEAVKKLSGMRRQCFYWGDQTLPEFLIVAYTLF